jgi:hypothetical protein
MAGSIDMQIEIKSTSAARVPFETLHDFQGDLKSLSDENYQKLRRQILSHGFASPINVWKDEDGKLNILDGHQRLKTVKRLADEGYEIPPLPINYVEASSRKEAKEILLAMTSSYGQMSYEGLNEYLKESEISLDEIEQSMVFPEIDFEEYKEQFDLNESDGSNEKNREQLYTKKINIPIYKPTQESKPSYESMFDSTKTKILIDEIISKNIPEDIKDFLIAASYRHTTFNYQNIAEFYCHADKQTQELMEKSALVLIDFNKAIEYGFVKLSVDLAEAYND